MSKATALLRPVACKADEHKEFVVDCWGNVQVLMRLVRAPEFDKRELKERELARAKAAA